MGLPRHALSSRQSVPVQLPGLDLLLHPGPSAKEMYRWLWDIRVSTCSDPLSDVGIGVFPFFRHLALVICCSLLGLLLRPFKAHGTPLAGLGLLPTKGIPLGLLRPAPGRNAAQIALPLPPGGRRPRQRVPRTMPLRPGLMTPFRIAASCPVRQSRSGLLPVPPEGCRYYRSPCRVFAGTPWAAGTPR